MRAYIVGVTGGIGSGKTTVCDEFAGCHRRTVIDADIVAREVVEPGQTALAEIVDAFGADLLDATGRLDRAHLKRMIFADETTRYIETFMIDHCTLSSEELEQHEQTMDQYRLEDLPAVIDKITELNNKIELRQPPTS